MGPKARREYLQDMRLRYHQFGRAVKSKILDEVCEVCGHHRKHVIRLFNRRPGAAAARKSGPRPRYDATIMAPLKEIWLAADQPCSKRLVGALPVWLPAWEARRGVLTAVVRRRLLAISPATIDRLLKPVRARLAGRGRTTTKPGSLLRQQIPIRAEAWDTDLPGFLEADTVAHCGESLTGNFIWSITYTDIFSGWTACRATWNRGAQGVIAPRASAKRSWPFCKACPALGRNGPAPCSKNLAASSHISQSTSFGNHPKHRRPHGQSDPLGRQRDPSCIPKIVFGKTRFVRSGLSPYLRRILVLLIPLLLHESSSCNRVSAASGRA